MAETVPRRPRRRLGIRVRLVASFVVLLALAVLVSIGVLRQVGRNRIDAQVFTRPRHRGGRPPRPVAAGAAHARAARWPDARRRVRRVPPGEAPRSDQAYLTFVGDRAFAEWAGSRVDLQRLPWRSLGDLTNTTRAGRSRPPESLRWLAVPVRAGDQVLGVLVATELLSGQRHSLQGTSSP